MDAKLSALFAVRSFSFGPLKPLTPAFSAFMTDRMADSGPLLGIQSIPVASGSLSWGSNGVQRPSAAKDVFWGCDGQRAPSEEDVGMEDTKNSTARDEMRDVEGAGQAAKRVVGRFYQLRALRHPNLTTYLAVVRTRHNLVTSISSYPGHTLASILASAPASCGSSCNVGVCSEVSHPSASSSSPQPNPTPVAALNVPARKTGGNPFSSPRRCRGPLVLARAWDGPPRPLPRLHPPRPAAPAPGGRRGGRGRRGWARGGQRVRDLLPHGGGARLPTPPGRRQVPPARAPGGSFAALRSQHSGHRNLFCRMAMLPTSPVSWGK